MTKCFPIQCLARYIIGHGPFGCRPSLTSWWVTVSRWNNQLVYLSNGCFVEFLIRHYTSRFFHTNLFLLIIVEHIASVRLKTETLISKIPACYTDYKDDGHIQENDRLVQVVINYQTHWQYHFTFESTISHLNPRLV